MSELVIAIDGDGTVNALHMDGFDLGFLGDKTIQRQTEILFDEKNQCWDIHYIVTSIPGDIIRHEALNGFAGYDEARRFEVMWVNACRLHSIEPETALGTAYAAFLRYPPKAPGPHEDDNRCFTMPDGDCISDNCMHTDCIQ